MLNFKEILLSLSGLNESDVFEKLSSNNQLNRDEKNLIYMYMFPRLLGDYEYPKRLREHRELTDTRYGHLEENLPEATLLVEAYRTPQYSKFIKHLMYSYTIDDSCTYIINEYSDKDLREGCECSICKTKLYTSTEWSDKYSRKVIEYPLLNNKRAFGSTETSLRICYNCLTQLKFAKNILEQVEPDLLTFRWRDWSGNSRPVKA